MYYPMYVDPTYILIIIGVLLSLAASTKVKSTFGRYSRVRSLSGIDRRSDSRAHPASGRNL